VKVLGIGNYDDLGSIYLRLVAEGHDVRVHVAAEDSRDVLVGLLAFEPDLHAGLAWVGRDGLILVEDLGWGELQDRLRAEGRHVVGGSAFGDRLEGDRAFGQAFLRELGMTTLPAHTFDSFADAIAFVEAHPARYVVKFHGSDLPSDANYVGMWDDGADVLATLIRHRDRWPDPPAFSLMAHVEGVETGLGAFFDGERFVGPINLDWEHKRFFAGDVGELTCEMGTVVTYRGGEKLFAHTLARAAPALAAARHVGYVNLNTIINADGVWPLELTCRFGYPGFAILSALFREPCGDILRGMRAFATYDGYAVGVVLTVPPFPYHHGYEELGKGLAIHIPPHADRGHLHFGEVAQVGGALITAGQVGYVMVATGRGDTLEEAQAAAYALARSIAIPNVRFRNDIGDRLRTTGLAELRRLGWLT
jgi:phosphoribosylamine--glycine ligase